MDRCAFIAVALMLTLGLLPALNGCAPRKEGAYVSRFEFNSLSRRVGDLEDEVNTLTKGKSNLPRLASGSAAAWGGANGAPAPVSKASGRPAAARGDEKSLYQQGQTLLKQKKYDQAAGVFSQMLAQNPNGSLAPNARYWLGECHYASGRYSQAALEFQRCAADYPRSDKAPDALLKLAYSYDRLGDGPRAMEATDQLLTRYPNSSAAGLLKSGRGGFRL